MRLNFETKTKIFVTGLGIIMVVVIVGAILPTARDIYGINRDTLNLKNYLDQKYKNVMTLRRSSQKIDDIKKQTDIFSATLYHHGDELKLITFLENTATNNKLTQKIQAPNLDKPENKIIKLSLSLNGAYPDILKYLSDLEKAPYFLVLNRIQVSTASERIKRDVAVPANLNLDLEMQLYVSE